MGLDMSVVFKLSSVEDLENLTNALKQTVTFQAKLQLEKDIKNLNERRAVLRVEVEALRMERHGLRKPSDNEKSEAMGELAKEDEGPSALIQDSERLIERLAEDPEEATDREQTDPSPERAE
ncbi:hypothetical protein KKH23_07775 [Patescibacteria group bacterium]|nr:hypothetical protein [Patescibacteria group bacterium]